MSKTDVSVHRIARVVLNDDGMSGTNWMTWNFFNEDGTEVLEVTAFYDEDSKLELITRPPE